MKIVVAGGSGFLGRSLAATLARDGHEIVVLTRGNRVAREDRQRRSVAWTADGETGPWAAEIDGAAVLVNLAGEPIAVRRWSDAQKERILSSRLQATRSLAAAVREAATPPPVFISGSAVGYYGPLGDEVATEETPPGSDFLARVCVQWEAEAMRATSARTRVVCIRTGVVLEHDGGALPKMLAPFKFGAGGPIGSGRQYLPWIHRDDWVALVSWAIRTPTATAALNATAPDPVTNADFARALGRALHRPAFMRTPGFLLRLMLGEMAGALLLSGQRAVPAKAERLGFRFRYPRVDEALGAILSSR